MSLQTLYQFIVSGSKSGENFGIEFHDYYFEVVGHCDISGQCFSKYLVSLKLKLLKYYSVALKPHRHVDLSWWHSYKRVMCFYHGTQFLLEFWLY